MTTDGNRTSVAVIGAGPAGLTAAYELVRRQVPVTVLEGDSMVGGISRTAEREGWRFDIGGHRFFTKVPEVEALWHEILPDEDFLLRPRMSRIFYDGKLYDYPLKASNALGNLGPVEAVRCVASYLWARIRPPKNQDTLEGWIVARFGKRLYQHFFKTYNEKLWGVPVDQLPADFAAQRIKNLSLVGAVVNALTPKRNQKEITSLIEEFQYPKYGPGMMWETAARKVQERGGTVVMEEKVRTVHWEPGRGVTGLTTVVTGGYGAGAGAPESSRSDIGAEKRYEADHFISSMPFSSLVDALDPKPPAEVLAAADALKYRDFLTVALVLPVEAGFPDNWIYIHSPDVQVGRIQNFGSWSRTGAPAWAWSSSSTSVTTPGTGPTRSSSPRVPASSSSSGWPRPPTSSAASSSGCRRPTRSTTPGTRRTSRSSGAGWRRTRRTCTRSGATACSATTTRTTRCSRPC
jgi:UDP-galactopyranose mutase